MNIKKIAASLLMLLGMAAAQARPTVTTAQDGTLTVTVNAQGDLAPSYFTPAQLAATKVRLESGGGYRLTRADVEQFFGVLWARPMFARVTDLDLSSLVLASNDDITYVRNYRDANAATGTLVLPETLTSIPAGSFDPTAGWSRVVFPDAASPARVGRTTITAATFRGMQSLRDVVVGTTVGTIEKDAFQGCVNLHSPDLHQGGLTTIGESAFAGCTSLGEVALPEGVTTIGAHAFENSSITYLHLPTTLVTIGPDVFNGCQGLTTLVIPSSVEYVGGNNFNDCVNLTDIYLLGSTTKAPNKHTFNANQTYSGYTYTPNGDAVTDRLDWRNSAGRSPVALHFPAGEEAYRNYANPFDHYARTGDRTGLQNQDFFNAGKVWLSSDWYVANPFHDIYGNTNELDGDYRAWKQFPMVAVGDLHVERRVVDGRWYSICYPFAMTESQIKTAFGQDAEVREFSGAHVATEGAERVLTLSFTRRVTQTRAHHPYMIHPGIHDRREVGIVGVKIEPELQARLEAESVTMTDERGVKYKFVGSYADQTYVPQYTYYYYPGSTTYAAGFYKAMKPGLVRFTPYSAAVVPSQNVAAAKVAMYVPAEAETTDPEAETTGISEVTAPQPAIGREGVYTLTGRQVRTQADSLEGLPAGIYIVGRKKIIIR